MGISTRQYIDRMRMLIVQIAFILVHLGALYMIIETHRLYHSYVLKTTDVQMPPTLGIPNKFHPIHVRPYDIPNFDTIAFLPHQTPLARRQPPSSATCSVTRVFSPGVRQTSTVELRSRDTTWSAAQTAPGAGFASLARPSQRSAATK